MTEITAVFLVIIIFLVWFWSVVRIWGLAHPEVYP